MLPLRILIADDHELLRMAVRGLLESDPGFQVIGEAATGKGTIAQVGLLRPDVVILDCAMPELNGLEVAARIGKSHPQTRMILLTASATPALQREARAMGIERCISKSDPAQNLIAALRALQVPGDLPRPVDSPSRFEHDAPALPDAPPTSVDSGRDIPEPQNALRSVAAAMNSDRAGGPRKKTD